MSVSAFGVYHGGDISKMTDKEKAAAGVGGVAAAGVVATQTKMPEHSHYSKDTRKYIKSLPAGVHEIDTKKLAKKPRKLGARKQQAPYVAAMAQERPTPYSPVPITRYKDGVIQGDNAHSVMANSMKGRKTLVKIEDADGYRPSRRTGEELVRRGQSKYQERRLKKYTGLSEKKIEGIRAQYKDSSRKANTHKRPHGVVEEGFKMSKKPFGVARAIGIAKSESKKDYASGALTAGGVGAFAATPVRRSAEKVKIKNGQMSAKDAKKIVSPGYRPGNKKSIQTMARNMGHMENSTTKVVQYKDGTAIPFDGNHRATARIVRGDKKIPVTAIEGGERPAVSAGRNLLHVGQKKLHQARMERGVFNPTKKTGKHTGESKVYSSIANGSPARNGTRVNVASTKFASGPSKAVLRTKQGLAIGTGTAMLGGAHHLQTKKKRK